MDFFLPVVVLGGMAQPASAHVYNATSDANNITCVYPLSGQYGLLSRILYYALWVFAVCFRKQDYLVIAALAFVMAFSSQAAVHAIVLAGTSANALYDLDAVGCWAILSVAALAWFPAIQFSRVLRESKFRPVFGYWAYLAVVGALCGAIALFRDYPEETACRSAAEPVKSELLTTPYQLWRSGLFNCSYQCFDTHQPMRAPSDIVAISPRRAFGALYTLLIGSALVTGVCGAYVGFLSCVFVSERKRTKAELDAVLALPAGNTAKSRSNRSKEKRKARQELQSGQYKPSRWICAYVNPVALPVIVMLNEFYLLASHGLPVSEQLFAVGQWAPWVTAGVALIAAWINHGYEANWKKRQEILAQEKLEFKELQLKRDIPVIKVNIGRVTTTWNTDFQEFAEVAKPEPTHPPASESSDTPPKSTILAVGNHLPANTDTLTRPPFKLHNIDKMPLIHHDMPCAMYQDWSPKDDGSIVIDSNGRGWIAKYGTLFSARLWNMEFVVGGPETV